MVEQLKPKDGESQNPVFVISRGEVVDVRMVALHSHGTDDEALRYLTQSLLDRGEIRITHNLNEDDPNCFVVLERDAKYPVEIEVYRFSDEGQLRATLIRLMDDLRGFETAKFLHEPGRSFVLKTQALP